MRFDIYECEDCGRFFGYTPGDSPLCCPGCKNDVVEMVDHDRRVS